MRLSLLLTLAVAAAPVRSAELVYDLALGAGRSTRSASAGAARRHALLESKRLLVGYGVRASVITGGLELYPVRVKDYNDSLAVGSARIATLNATIHAAVKAAEPLELGFNLDVAGVSAGASEGAVYRASAGAAPVRVGARPSTGNLFLFGSNDIGSLNSEFYASWRATPELSVRAGLSHFLTEYRVDRELASGTRLFRQFTNLVFVGVRWTPGRR